MDDHGDSEPEQQAEEGNAKRTIRRWTQDEHNKLVEQVARQQETGQTEICWAAIARELPGRTGKQCRHRWVNSCQPFTKRGVWDLDEEHVVAQLHASHGSAWSHIASKLKGRSENSVKNHYNALYRSKYLDSKKESVLANYVKLLREGHPQCVETYEQALEITRMHREQAISRITGGSRLSASKATAALSPMGTAGSGEMDMASLALAAATANGAGSSSHVTGAPSPSGRVRRGSDCTSAVVSSWVQPTSSVTTGQELAQALQATTATELMQGPTNNLVAELTAADGFDWQLALQGLDSEGPVDRVARALGQDMMVGRATPTTDLSGPSNWQPSQQLQAGMGGISTAGEASSAQHQGPTRSFSLSGRTAMLSQMNGLTLQTDSLDLDLNQLLEQQPPLDTPQLLLGVAQGSGSSTALGRQSCPGLNNQEPLMDLLVEVGGSNATQPGSESYGKWISYSGSGSAAPGGVDMMKTMDASGVRGVPKVFSTSTDALQPLQEFVGNQTQQLHQLAMGSGNVVTTSSPLLQSMLANSQGSREVKETLMGRIKEDQAVNGDGRFSGPDALPRPRPGRRRSYAELYADSPTQQQLESALAARSQPGSILAADLSRGPYGPNSATALNGALNDVDQTRADLTGPNSAHSNGAGMSGRPPVAWGGTRDAVFLPPGWAPQPDLDDGLDIDDALYAAPAAPRAPRARRHLEILSGQANQSGGPSPPSTTAHDIPPAPPPTARNVASGLAADFDGPFVSQAQRRRHSVSYLPIAGAGTGVAVPTEVDMSDLAAYVPGQNRRRSMSVLTSGGTLGLATAPSSTGNLPAPMHMGVSDAPGRKQRFRRRSVEPYSAGNLAANALLDPALVSLLTQHGSKDAAGSLQADEVDMLMDLTEQFGPTLDNSSGLTPMVSGIDLNARTASGSTRLYGATSSGLPEPGSAASCPATVAGTNMLQPFAVLDPSYWDQLQDALGSINTQQSLSRGGSNSITTQQQQRQQMYLAQEVARTSSDFMAQPVQVKQEMDAPQPSGHHLGSEPGSAHGVAGQHNLTATSNGMLQHTPAAGSPLSGSVPTSSATALGEFASSLMGQGAESILVGGVDPNNEDTTGEVKPSLPLLDTTMSVSFNRNQLSPTTDMLMSPQLNSIFRNTGAALDASDADAVLCPLRPPLGRDDNSFKERLNIGAPLASLDTLLKDGVAEVPDAI